MNIQFTQIIQIINCPISVQLHKKNIGLTQQWLQIWTPAEGVKEVAFVFEDDEEVNERTAAKSIKKLLLSDICLTISSSSFFIRFPRCFSVGLFAP